MLLCVNRQTTSDAALKFLMSSGYHSVPYSIPCEPFRSDDRKDFKTPALTLLNSLLNASASSASRESWLMKTSEPAWEDISSAGSSGLAFFFVDEAIDVLLLIEAKFKFDASNSSVRDEGASPLIFESRQASLGKR